MPDLRIAALERAQGRALGDRNVVAGEFVFRQQLAHLELDQLEQLGIVDHVDLVHEHDQRRHADLAGEQNMFARLRHRAVGRRNHQDRAVHLRRTGDHVLHIIGVAGTIDMRIMALLRLVFDMRRRNRDAARLLLRRLVDLIIGRERRPAGLRQNLGDRRRQRGLAVVDVTNRPDVAMRLRPCEFFLGHGLVPMALESAIYDGAPIRLFARYCKSQHRRARPPCRATSHSSGGSWTVCLDDARL